MAAGRESTRLLRGLSPSEDAYGQILLAAFEGRGGQEIIERDDGLIYCGDPSDYFAPHRKWPATERRAMRHVRGRVLDVGCGAGRVSLHLQDRGHDVVAIDESPGAVEVARRRGVRDARVLGVRDAGRSLGIFDTIVLMRNNLGLAGREQDAKRFLHRLSALTSEQGLIVTDSVDPGRIDPVFRDYRRRRGAQRIRVRWRHHASPWFYYHLLTPLEFEQLLLATGWRVLHLIDDGSPRYAAVLGKEALGGQPLVGAAGPSTE